MQKTKPVFQDLVTVIRKTSDGRLDYKMDRQRAKELYNQGKLAFDLTNGKYTEDFKPCQS